MLPSLGSRISKDGSLSKDPFSKDPFIRSRDVKRLIAHESRGGGLPLSSDAQDFPHAASPAQGPTSELQRVSRDVDGDGPALTLPLVMCSLTLDKTQDG